MPFRRFYVLLLDKFEINSNFDHSNRRQMDEIIQILVFAGAMIASVVIQSAKNKKKAETTSPKEVLEEVFPTLEEFQEVPSVKPQPVSPPKATSRKKPFQANKKQKKPEVTTPVVSAPSPNNKLNIRLNNRAEAKRAFIYSEIFNRKY